jgi:3-oxosteroid 1-dehydrogenase
MGGPDSWDMEADVVILGFGGAGACAAIEAHEAGTKVLILEKQPRETHYSNTRMSGGGFHSPDPTGDPAALKAYTKAMFSGENISWMLEGEQPEHSDALAEAWTEYCPQNVAFIKKLDPDFKPILYPTHGTACPDFPGAKASKYQLYGSSFGGEMRIDIPTKDLPKEKKTFGEAFFAVLRGAVEKKNVELLYRTAAKRLIQNQQGEVIGAMATREDREIACKAKKAVIISTGGYEFNKAMRQAFLEGPGVEGWAFYGSPGFLQKWQRRRF